MVEGDLAGLSRLMTVAAWVPRGLDNGTAILRPYGATDDISGDCPVYIKRPVNAEVVEKQIQHKRMDAILKLP